MSKIQKVLKENIAIGIVLLFSILIAIALPFFAGKTVHIAVTTDPTPTIAPRSITKPVLKTITYAGRTGKDALTLLQSKTSVTQDKSGLVTTIGGKKAESTRHEYWAFYVNGKLATVGPAEYETKNTDTIMWKIEKY
jgi:Domain of unknown function (DUF4430)